MSSVEEFDFSDFFAAARQVPKAPSTKGSSGAEKRANISKVALPNIVNGKQFHRDELLGAKGDDYSNALGTMLGRGVRNTGIGAYMTAGKEIVPCRENAYLFGKQIPNLPAFVKDEMGLSMGEFAAKVAALPGAEKFGF